MISFNKIIKFWKNNEFEIILGICIAFILVFFIYHKITGKKGTWSKSYYYSNKKDFIKKRNNSKESSGERECRRVLQYIFNKPFNNQRPDFLCNPVTGGNFNLELDCYDSELKLAVEYNGEQHYKYIPYFHKNKEAFLNQKYRDEIKRRMCKDAGVTLIEVPNTIKLEDIKGYLINKLRNAGYRI
jgi:hypothetical protein